ncbi:STAS domain-containing protein [Rhodocyclus tenuis]|uniref:Anti-sigma factor antagonist n=1 Tax=Rhodocyclus gracilis TaxID=2929842 RepID=A0ABX0WHC1_9RHOO|nr:STAS domain-containing protein [Rhodocyclus gracilis]NJA89114.1 STAS domain-containing protein [Rhodocyclus gracilis]
MQTQTSVDNGQGMVKLAGRFDFNSHRDFRAAYDTLMEDAQVQSVIVDLGGVDYLDSSALGMLLMLRDKAGLTGKTVAIANARGSVKQVLDIANFRKLFAFV